MSTSVGKLYALPAEPDRRETPEVLLTAPQLAAQLGVPTSWVYEKAALGVLPSLKVGSYRRFKWSQIEAWLEEVNA